MTDTQLKRGKKDARIEPSVFLHNFHDAGATYAATTLPTTFSLAGGPAGDVLGNDVYGCCVVVAFEVLRMFAACTGVDASGNPIYQKGFRRAHTAYTEYLYFKFGEAMGEGPHADNGCNILDFLMWCHKNGLLDLFATLDKSQPLFDIYARQIAVQFFGLLVGLEGDADLEQEFNNGECWGAMSSTPDPDMGHGVAFQGWNPSNDFDWTWGKPQCTTASFDENCVTEVHVVMTNELADRNGVNKEALTAAIVGLPGYDAIPISDLSDAPEIDADEPVTVVPPESVTTPVDTSRATLLIRRAEHEVVKLVERAVSSIGSAEIKRILEDALRHL